MTAPDVVVIGAGVIGLSTAVHLAGRGVRVEVVDPADPGACASRTNAGWIVPSMCEPVPSPAAVRTACRWILRSDGPLKVGVEPSARYVWFLARMLASSRPAAYERGLSASAHLAAGAVDAFDDLHQRGVNFERHSSGILQLFLSSANLRAHEADQQELADYGLRPAPALSAQEVLELEPAVGQDVVGGLLSEGDQHVDPRSLVDGLTATCRSLGVRFRVGSPIAGIADRGDHVEITTAGERLRASRLLLAAGVGTRQLARMLGTSIPVRAGKGYGFDYRPSAVSFRHALYLADHKVAVTPLHAGTRVAGTMEFGAENAHIDQRRARSVARALTAYVPSWPDASPLPWTGLRPMTPDGLPLIGHLPGSLSVFLATGHAMLGITLGPITGALVSRLILDGDASPLLDPFDPQRYASGRWRRGSR